MTKVQMRGDKGRQIEGAEDGYHGKRGNTSSVVCQEKKRVVHTVTTTTTDIERKPLMK
jgi:hypothetical protein